MENWVGVNESVILHRGSYKPSRYRNVLTPSTNMFTEDAETLQEGTAHGNCAKREGEKENIILLKWAENEKRERQSDSQMCIKNKDTVSCADSET